MILTDLINKEQVITGLKAKNTHDAFSELTAQLPKNWAHSVLSALQERENQASTNLGNGVALPHARVEGLEKPLLLIGTHLKGISWGNGPKVKLVFLFATPAGESGLHLKILAQLGNLLADPELVRHCLLTKNHDDLFAYLKSLDVEKSGFKNLPRRDVFLELHGAESGLDSTQAAERLKKYGPNQLKQIGKKSLFKSLFSNFTNLLAILMWIGAFMAFLVQMSQIGWAIIGVIFINALFSFWQEFRAEKAIDALKNLLPSYARVLRDGHETKVPTQELVPGDVVVFEEGDNISADGRLLQAHELRVDNSVFSGESHPAYKMAEPMENGKQLIWTEIPNLVFAGTSVVAGSGKAVVVATGMSTEIGKIAFLTQSVKDELSPLQREINRLVKVIALVAVVMGTVFFFVGKFVAGISMVGAVIFALGIILGNVPEGLMPTVTLALAMGVQRMAKRHALIKKLSSVETLGCTNVICTDKTGTLTTNQINVKKVWLNNKMLELSGTDYEPKGAITWDDKPYDCTQNDDGFEIFINTAVLCNSSQLREPDAENRFWNILGDPTEAALLVMASKAGYDLDKIRADWPLLKRFPFESNRKRMSSIHAGASGQAHVYVKGAPAELLANCGYLKRGQIVKPLRAEDVAQLTAHIDEFARTGYRVLGLAYKTIAFSDVENLTMDEAETGLTFVGLTAMYDPPRPEVAPAIAKCRAAGIRTVMITGDYGLTALTIARQVGIAESDQARVITGLELNEMSDEQLKNALQNEVVFARVSPEHKLRVVSTFRELGQIVAVTGDGVNDAPALKRADIGVAMGIRGTDVAKESAEMILTDDNFASIVAAIEEGRTVFENIKKFITYIFAHLVPEAVPFILYVIFKLPVPITAMQILAIDLGSETLPALALGVENTESGVMSRPPRPQNRGLVDKVVLTRGYLYLGMFNAVAVLIAFFVTLYKYGWHWGVQLEPSDVVFSNLAHLKATTMVYAGIVVFQMVNIFACRSEKQSVFKIGLRHNRLIFIGLIFEVLIMLSLVYLPVFQGVFSTIGLTLGDWGLLLVLMVGVFGAEEGRKWWTRRLAGSKA